VCDSDLRSFLGKVMGLRRGRLSIVGDDDLTAWVRARAGAQSGFCFLPQCGPHRPPIPRAHFRPPGPLAAYASFFCPLLGPTSGFPLPPSQSIVSQSSRPSSPYRPLCATLLSSSLPSSCLQPPLFPLPCFPSFSPSLTPLLMSGGYGPTLGSPPPPPSSMALTHLDLHLILPDGFYPASSVI